MEEFSVYFSSSSASSLELGGPWKGSSPLARVNLIDWITSDNDIGNELSKESFVVPSSTHYRSRFDDNRISPELIRVYYLLDTMLNVDYFHVFLFKCQS